MRELLIVETRDAADHRDPERMVELALGTLRRGVPASIFLTENGAFNARRGTQCPLQAAMAEGLRVSVDRFALEERGIAPDQLQGGVSVEEVDLVVDRFSDGACVMWR